VGLSVRHISRRLKYVSILNPTLLLFFQDANGLIKRSTSWSRLQSFRRCRFCRHYKISVGHLVLGLFNNVLSTAQDYSINDRMIPTAKNAERNGHDLLSDTIPRLFLEGMRKSTKTEFRICEWHRPTGCLEQEIMLFVSKFRQTSSAF